MDFSLVNNVIVLCAKRRSGKSILLRYLVKKSQHHFNKIFSTSRKIQNKHQRNSKQKRKVTQIQKQFRNNQEQKTTEQIHK